MTPKEILEEVKRRIVAMPELYDQQVYCGTQCCIAGHIDVIVNGEAMHAMRIRDREGISAVESTGLRALNEPDNIWLFGQVREEEEEEEEEEGDRHAEDPAFWPYDLSREYRAAGSPAGRALVGCKAIDLYIKERRL